MCIDTIAEHAKGWIELLVSFLLYKPVGYLVNAEKLAYRCQQYYTATPFDELLFSVIQRNHYKTLELASNYFPPVFAAHLAFMFEQAGIITSSATEYPTTYTAMLHYSDLINLELVQQLQRVIYYVMDCPFSLTHTCGKWRVIILPTVVHLPKD